MTFNINIIIINLIRKEDLCTDMAKREFIPPKGAIRTQVSTDIAAPPEQVAAVYRDVDRWGDLYPKTIVRARVVETGENWVQVEVQHRLEGRVPNTLIFLSPLKIGLFESKHRFNARFLNDFQPADGQATHYVITSYISLKGIYRLLKPLLVGYVHRQSRRQMMDYVLRPIKEAVERQQQKAAPAYTTRMTT